MNKNKLIWILGLILLVSLVSAGSPNPEVYWGYVYLDGAVAPLGTILTAESTSTGELFVNQTLPFDPEYLGSYSVKIVFDDSFTGLDEGADPGETLTWKVNGVSSAIPAAGDDTAESGNTNNDYLIYAILDPIITTVLQQSSSSINVRESLNLTVLLNNTGAGSGNATLANISDIGVISDLPQMIYVSRDNTNQTIVNVSSSVCGEYFPLLTIDYYNIAGDHIDTITEHFSFNVTGHDLLLENIELSETSPIEGDTISITTTLANNGTDDITGFNVSFYHDSNLIDSIGSNLTLISGESVNISITWDAVLGASLLRAVVGNSSTECSSENNEITAGLSVQEDEPVWTSSGGGSSFGDRGVGIAKPTNTDCNDSIDNDGDNLTDYPADPGCESPDDWNESDILSSETGILENEEDASKSMGYIPPEDEIKYIKGSSNGIKRCLNDAEPEERAGLNFMTGFVTKISEASVNWILILIFIILLTILTYEVLSEANKRSTQHRSKQHGIRVDIFHKSEKKKETAKKIPISSQKKNTKEKAKDQKTVENTFNKEIGDYIQKRGKENLFGRFKLNQADGNMKDSKDRTEEHRTAEKSAVIQKSIKISSKKDIIDKLKEVYEKND